MAEGQRFSCKQTLSLRFPIRNTISIIGYDVWMGNTRGNSYSRNHVSFDSCSNCPEFWNFGFDESGVFDYKAEVDHIIEVTGQEAVHFIGHSMGTTQFLVSCTRGVKYQLNHRTTQKLNH